MQVGGAPFAPLECLPVAAGACIVPNDLWLHGLGNRALVDRDSEWHPVSVDGQSCSQVMPFEVLVP